MQSTRRDFLRLGAAGAAAASALGGGTLLLGCGSSPPAAGFKHLRSEDLAVLRALMPAVLRGSLRPDDGAAIDATLRSFDQMLEDLSPQVVVGVLQAFDLMELGLARGLATGQWSGWESATLEDAESALLRLRDSSIEVLVALYAAFVRIIVCAWYTQAGPLAETGYPGPPTKIAGALGTLDTHGVGAMPPKRDDPPPPDVEPVPATEATP